MVLVYESGMLLILILLSASILIASARRQPPSAHTSFMYQSQSGDASSVITIWLCVVLHAYWLVAPWHALATILSLSAQLSGVGLARLRRRGDHSGGARGGGARGGGARCGRARGGRARGGGDDVWSRPIFARFVRTPALPSLIFAPPSASLRLDGGDFVSAGLRLRAARIHTTECTSYSPPRALMSCSCSGACSLSDCSRSGLSKIEYSHFCVRCVCALTNTIRFHRAAARILIATLKW